MCMCVCRRERTRACGSLCGCACVLARTGVSPRMSAGMRARPHTCARHALTQIRSKRAPNYRRKSARALCAGGGRMRAPKHSAAATKKYRRSARGPVNRQSPAIIAAIISAKQMRTAIAPRAPARRASRIGAYPRAGASPLASTIARAGGGAGPRGRIAAQTAARGGRRTGQSAW